MNHRSSLVHPLASRSSTPPPVRSGRWLAVLLTSAVCLALAAACSSPETGLRKKAGSAVWATPDDLQHLSTEARQALRDGGVREVFLVAGRGVTEADGSVGISVELGRGTASSSARLPVTLVVRPGEDAAEGFGVRGSGAAEAAVADGWAAALRRLRLDAQETGLAVVGYHLDLVPPRGEDALAAYGRTLGLLRERLDEDLFLSASLDPAALAAPAAAEVAAGLDFAAAWLYGPRTDGGPGPRGDAAWSLQEAEAGLARLAELKLPFLLGVGIVGRLQRLDDGGEWTSVASLGRLFRTPGLAPAVAGGLEVLDRQSYGFRADRALRVGEWSLQRGDEVRVTRLSSYHLRRAAERAESVAPGLHLGQLYHRLRRPGEELTLPASALAGANSGGIEPQIEVTVEPVEGRSAGRGSRLFRVRLANRGAQPTEVAFYDNNYLELHALSGHFGEVDGGSFQRYELTFQGERVTTRRALSNADGVKLFVPVLEPGDEEASGTVQLLDAAGDGPVVEVDGRFVLPGGDELKLPARRWPEPAAAEDASP